mmetsp:Transcript_27192/g.78217  ORF Transcript_27192/g.78217 Transcript_27192/m.78217 type:complete len:90 (-) Transcript_27192:57-326(-)
MSQSASAASEANRPLPRLHLLHSHATPWMSGERTAAADEQGRTAEPAFSADAGRSAAAMPLPPRVVILPSAPQQHNLLDLFLVFFERVA